MLKETRLIKIGHGIAATMTAFCVHAANGQPLPAPKVNALTQKVWDNPDVTEQSKGIRTLQDYIVQERKCGTTYSRITRSLLPTAKTDVLSVLR